MYSFPNQESADCLDTELARRLFKADHSAYTAIYNKYSKGLYIFALRRLGDAEESQDIIHDVFLSLWNRKEQVDLTDNLSGYLFRAVRNKIITAIAKRKVTEDFVSSFNQFVEEKVYDADHILRYKELADIIQEEIDKLPNKMRMVFELSRKAELSRKEIAIQLGLSEQTVKSHLHHALSILKKKLGLTAHIMIAFFYIEKIFKNF
ncbi:MULTISPECIES: RNA polymerase sigma factor [Sphingobacterium]|uniref:RNA polymerase sigma factor n=1 Tax=Sphingobacterium TaxID=28453 RepID=UPI0013D963B1|nr:MULTISPECIES: RNA polymerase sigma-70 factor [unclassified Sphingobacterium]